MKALPPHAGRSMAHRLGRTLLALGTVALLATAWLGWASAGAQGALENLWSLCSVR